MAKEPLDKDDDFDKEPGKKKPKGINKLLIAFLVLLIAVLGILAYVFASKSAAPTYRTKIERIMFDKANKSPKFVITLPDREEVAKGSGLTTTVETAEKKEETIENVIEDASDEAFSPEKVIQNIPHIGKLAPIEGHIPLKIIETNPDLEEDMDGLTLPKNSGSKSPWTEYGKVVDVAPNFYKVAVIFRDLGMDTKFTETISAGLSDNVSFSFSPYSAALDEQIKAARTNGHETFIDIAFSSKNFSLEDSGPLAINLDSPANDITTLLQKNISVKAPFSGVLLDKGKMNEENALGLKALMEEIKKRGLALLDATDTSFFDNMRIPGLATKKADIIITEEMKADEVKSILARAENIALTEGQVLVAVDPKPYLVFLLKNWIDTFSPQLSYEEMKQKNIEKMPRPFALVPASMMVVE